MKRHVPVMSRRTLLRTAAAVVVAALCAFIAYRLFGPRSPEDVRNQTIRALTTGNTVTLFAMADPMDVRRLHLTPAAVYGILSQTIWRHGYPTFNGPFQRISPQPPDVAAWIYREPNASPQTPYVYIPAIQDPNGRWYLNLSRLLEVSCMWATSDIGSVREMRRLYRDLARSYGVTGLRGHFGGYVTFSPPGTPQDWKPVGRD